jgi:ABC-type multidrug transport system permease subunit
MHPIPSITITRLKEFVRRPEAVFWVYFFPVLMIVVLGLAFQNQTIETFNVDIIQNEYSADLIQQLSGQQQIQTHLVNAEESSVRLRLGKSVLAITAGPDVDGRKQFDYLFDPKRPGAGTAENIVDGVLQAANGRVDAFTAQKTEFNELGGTYVDFLVPGLLGIGLMGGGMWGVGYAIVDMRIRKLLKRFMATPMRRTHFLISMMLSRLVFMVPQIALTLLVAYLMFGVRIYGSVPAVLFLVVLGAFEFSAVGLLIGSRAQTAETASGLMNFVMLPMYTLCGAFFSYERFPEIFHPVIRWLPLTPIIDSLRSVMMDGESLFAQWPEIGVMTVWCVIPFGVAMLIFRWRD